MTCKPITQTHNKFKVIDWLKEIMQNYDANTHATYSIHSLCLQVFSPFSPMPQKVIVTEWKRWHFHWCRSDSDCLPRVIRECQSIMKDDVTAAWKLSPLSTITATTSWLGFVISHTMQQTCTIACLGTEITPQNKVTDGGAAQTVELNNTSNSIRGTLSPLWRQLHAFKWLFFNNCLWGVKWRTAIFPQLLSKPSAPKTDLRQG
jgi:hypothetical protein